MDHRDRPRPASGGFPLTRHTSLVEAWESRCGSGIDRPALRYFDGTLTAGELDAASNALAVHLRSRGVAAGDRIGIQLQNIPYFPLCLLAIWKLGAIAVPLNPMYHGRELRHLVDDAQLVGLVAAAGPSLEKLRHAVIDTAVRWILCASEHDYQTRNRPRGDGGSEASPDGDLREIISENLGRTFERAEVGTDDPAIITYTSGTTGPPKGAVNTHANCLHAMDNFGRWVELSPEDVVFAMAPLFHITGMSLNAGVALLGGSPLVLTGRFDAAAALEAFREHGVTVTIGSITAFNAFLRVPQAEREHFRSVRALYSGGAPIPPSTIARFEEQFGHTIHNCWGMTETTGGGIAVPLGGSAPVHPATGTLSVGVPMQNVTVRIVDELGKERPRGEEGELEIGAPQIVPGYWRNAEATAHTFPGGRLRTGDVAIVDEAGWIYVVDRLKDLINASGFKVWPREVEDVLYEHPAVFEAAVVGRPDDYRGETVVAYVSLNPGATATPEDIVAFARTRLAAYKCPRQVQIVDELPTTATGKIRRAELRDVRRPPGGTRP